MAEQTSGDGAHKKKKKLELTGQVPWKMGTNTIKYLFLEGYVPNIEEVGVVSTPEIPQF